MSCLLILDFTLFNHIKSTEYLSNMYFFLLKLNFTLTNKQKQEKIFLQFSNMYTYFSCNNEHKKKSSAKYFPK